MSKLSTVHYHQHGREAIELFVVKHQPDGTMDLARERGAAPIITGIALSKEPGDGKATRVVVKETPKDPAKPSLKELRAQVKRASEAAEKAQEAADAAKGTDQEEELTKAALAAIGDFEDAKKALEAVENAD